MARQSAVKSRSRKRSANDSAEKSHPSKNPDVTTQPRSDPKVDVACVYQKFNAAPDFGRFPEREAAVLLNREPTTLATWRHLGKGPAFVKDGRYVFYTKAALLDAMTAGKECRSTSEYDIAPRVPLEALAVNKRDRSAKRPGNAQHSKQGGSAR